MAQLTLEDIVAKIPEVQAVIADDLKRKRDAITSHRNRLIDQIADADASTIAREASISKLASATEKARLAFEKAKSEQLVAEQDLTELRSQWSNWHSLLRRDFGNAAVDAAACRVSGWLVNLTNREQIVVHKAAEYHEFGAYRRPKYPQAVEELKGIQRQIEDANKAARELEALMTTKGHPEEITAKAEAIVAKLIPTEDQQ